MKDEFIKEKKIENKTEEQVQIELIKNIIETKRQLELANNNFEYADGDLIDYYTYEIKANRAKLDYLVKKAKSISIEIDMINQLKISLYEDKVV